MAKKENEEHVVIEGKTENKKKFNPLILIIIGAIVIFVAVVVTIVLLLSGVIAFRFVKSSKHTNTVEVNRYADYQLTGNSIEAFDLYFLQLENNKKNTVYSPLSIKYALEMLSEGAKGNTKKEITNILGSYNNRTYPNNKNMSFANALFVKDSYKKEIKDSYTKTLTTKYNANVLYDEFKSPKEINSWVSEKTFDLIDHLYDDVSDYDFILLNALAIDMEWNKKIQSEHEDYEVTYNHENYSKYVGALDSTDYYQLPFQGISYKAKAGEIAAVVNKYDLYNTIGEAKIRETVKNAYNEWKNNGEEDYCGESKELDIDAYLDQYIEQIKANYKKYSSSTDFSFYTDDKVKVFAKNLKTYDNTTLQYVAIMPTKDSLDTYIKNTKAEDINTLISNLKGIELSSFKDGVITEISGYIPMFNFEYELDLMKDLKTLGIKDVFDSSNADLSNMTKSNVFIDDARHKANIEFSNDGIKAGAVTAIGGKGAIDCGFDYLYEVPVEKIDLTFDKPYLFIIRDKDTNEAWFVGSVYEPMKYVEPTYE